MRTYTFVAQKALCRIRSVQIGVLNFILSDVKAD